MRLRLALTILALAAGAARAETLPSYDSYKSWFVVCDNGLSCVAKGFPEDAVRAEVTIERAAGATGAVSARIAAETPFALNAVAVDGQPLSLDPADWTLESAADLTSATTSRPEAVQALADSLRNGTALTLGKEAAVPLDGLTAALLKIDERQGRLGTVTALLRKGPLPAARVPPAPDLPTIANRPITAVLAPEEAARLAARLRVSEAAAFAAEDCEEDRLALEPSVYLLDASRALVLFSCVMGAYQGSSIGFLVPRGAGAAVRLEAPIAYGGNSGSTERVTLFTEGDFDPATGALFMSARGRGLADCGTSANWIFDGERFRLSSLSAQMSCGGVEPGDWPTLFRSIQ